MTRINLPPPAHLTDQHALAEYRELPRVPALALAASLRGDLDGPPRYTLGAGHVRFFFRRLRFLADRHALIVAELVDRGFKLAHRGPLDVPDLPGAVDWTPDAEGLAVNLARLRDKLWAPPRVGFYTYRGRPVGADFYGAMP